MLFIGTKYDNTTGATGQLDASEFNDLEVELQNPVKNTGQIGNIAVTDQLSRAMFIHGFGSEMFFENSGSANLSNLTPYTAGGRIAFSAAFVTGNSITITINGTPVVTNFLTDNATTYGNIRTNILAAFPAATVYANANALAVSIYQAGVTYTITVTVTGGASQPNHQESRGLQMPDSYAEMDGVIISFFKSVANTTTPQINIGQSTGALLGAKNVFTQGGGTIPAGAMIGFCRCRYNMGLDYWELLQFSGIQTTNLSASVDWHSILLPGFYFIPSGGAQTNSPDGTTNKAWFVIVNSKYGDTTNSNYSAQRLDTFNVWNNIQVAGVWGTWDVDIDSGNFNTFIPEYFISIFDNTAALPVAPSDGDTYIALVTANTWTINRIYRFRTANNSWYEIIPQIGHRLLHKDSNENWIWNGLNWGPRSGVIPTADNSSIDSTLNAWNKLLAALNTSVYSGTIFANPIVSTYSLIYTNNSAYMGGILDKNGDVHFIGFASSGSAVGQKISSSGVVSTYTLVNNAANAYSGGCLMPNGEIHFVVYNGDRGQKISSSGVVTTYSLLSTNQFGAYRGGVIAPNGDLHFVPYSATIGQKITSAGVVTTYSLMYTVTNAYTGGVLAPNGDVNFVPYSANRGQKITSAGVVTTYSLIYTVAQAYRGGVLASNGDIHFVPYNAAVGQKITSSGVVTTYSLIYTVANAYSGGVLSSNGDIYFVPSSAAVGQKITSAGVVTTYSLVYTAADAYAGGVLTPNGDILFIPSSAVRGMRLSVISLLPFGQAICMHPYFNKY